MRDGPGQIACKLGRYIYIYVALLFEHSGSLFGRAQRCMERSSASHIEIKDIQMICKLGLYT